MATNTPRTSSPFDVLSDAELDRLADALVRLVWTAAERRGVLDEPTAPDAAHERRRRRRDDVA